MPTSPSTTPRRAHASRLRACALASLASLAVVAGVTSLGAGCGARTGLMVDGVVADANVVTDVPDVSDMSDAEAEAEVVTCTPGVITLAKATPAVMFVLDRSGSMADSLGATNGNQSKWTLLANALRATLPTVDDAMQIGALFFPSAGAGGPGSSQCSVPGAPDLSPATGNVQPLLKLMQQTRPNGGTPTADALQVASARLLGVRAASTARALVLATDGAPDCDASLDASSCRCSNTTRPCRGQPEFCLDDTRTVSRIAAISAEGVPTYVIGILAGSDTGFADVLDAMAVAGGRAQTSGAHKYYAASSAAELDAALVDIRNQVAACTYLTTSVPDARGTIVVTVDGVEVPFDATGTDGWKWADASNGEIALVGDACKRAAATLDPAIVATVTCQGT